MTGQILQELPFPEHLSNVAAFASMHHEGYGALQPYRQGCPGSDLGVCHSPVLENDLIKKYILYFNTFKMIPVL
jgi:hypothetical protein